MTSRVFSTTASNPATCCRARRTQYILLIPHASLPVLLTPFRRTRRRFLRLGFFSLETEVGGGGGDLGARLGRLAFASESPNPPPEQSVLPAFPKHDALLFQNRWKYTFSLSFSVALFADAARSLCRSSLAALRAFQPSPVILRARDGRLVAHLVRALVQGDERHDHKKTSEQHGDWADLQAFLIESAARASSAASRTEATRRWFRRTRRESCRHSTLPSPRRSP